MVIGKTTVDCNSFLTNAMRKRGGANRTLAALKAIEFGLIQPADENARPRSLGAESK